MTTWLNHNGKIVEANKPLITAGNRGFRYGDGLFETMKLADGQITLAHYHFERLFNDMQLLELAIPVSFTPSFFLEQITTLCKKNGHGHTARIRLTIFRGSGELFEAADSVPEYIIETFLLEGADGLNENGLILGVYKDVCKSIGKFACIKSNNYLPYTMAARYAKQQRWNDSLILNSKNAVCESSIANVFIIKEGTVITPGLEESCVAGVMRRHLLATLPGLGYNVKEQTVTLTMLREADEIFLTNAVRGIRWVRNFEDVAYTNKKITEIYHATRNTW